MNRDDCIYTTPTESLPTGSAVLAGNVIRRIALVVVGAVGLIMERKKGNE